MELLFQEEKIHFDQQPSVDLIIEKINDWLGHTYYFSHLVVDGLDVFEDPEQYLMDNPTDVQKLEVIALTAREFTNDILLTAEDYLKGATKEFSPLMDGFYNNPTSNNWTDFNGLLEGMQWINQVIKSIDQMKEKPMNWDEYLKLAGTFDVELKNLAEAVENNDHVLIADIIRYELLPVYEALQQEIGTTIDKEGTRHDVN